MDCTFLRVNYLNGFENYLPECVKRETYLEQRDLTGANGRM